MENFALGIDRPIPSWYAAEPPMVNLGAGRKQITDATPLDAEHGWLAGEEMPFESDSIGTIYAYHFLEHLTKIEIISVLRECERILVPGGVMNTVTPHWDTEAANQDLDHKSRWTESTWKNLFKNPYYDGTMPRSWLLYEVGTLIIGVFQRNLMVVSQLRKDWE